MLQILCLSQQLLTEVKFRNFLITLVLQTFVFCKMSSAASASAPRVQAPVNAPVLGGAPMEQVAKATPVLNGFRAIWVTPTEQWLLNLNTLQCKVWNVVDEGSACNVQFANDKLQYVKQAMHIIPAYTPEPQDDSDNEAEIVDAYKEFDLHKMVRPNGTLYYYDLSKKTSCAPSVRFWDETYVGATCNDPDDDGNDFTCKFLLYKYKLPAGGTDAWTFLRLQDFQVMLQFQRGDEREQKWIAKNWDCWRDSFSEVFPRQNFPGFRSVGSFKARHVKNPKDFDEPALGDNCLEFFATSSLFVLWWLMKLAKTIRKSVNFDKDKKRCRFVFEQMVSIVLRAGDDFVIPLRSADEVNEDRQHSTSPSTFVGNYMELQGMTIKTLSSLTDTKEFAWLRSALTRICFESSVCEFHFAYHKSKAFVSLTQN